MSNKTGNGGNGQVLQRCVSLANGALSPDQRVNYEFGLVLGVDEFRQEQLYFLEKDRLHQRSLHGYGTVYGLGVTAAPPADDSDEMMITVEPGLAVDQFGRTVVVRDEQCARLGAWLARQLQDGTAPPVESGADYRAYVVLSYDECLDALVPVPGEPCSSSEATQAPSRIRDSFRIELRWLPPAMTAWDAVRAVADLMATVRFVPGLAPDLSDEDTIVDLVRALVDPPSMPPCSADPEGTPPSGSPPLTELLLPLETARAALDRIFQVWVTEVRPHIHGQVNLTDPGDDALVESGILLACIDFAPDAAFSLAAPKIDHATVHDDGRPFLLHTQLMQELLLLGNGGVDEPVCAFATVQVLGSHELRAWIHHPLPLDIVAPEAEAVRVLSGGRELTVDSVTPVAGTDNLVDISTAADKANRILPGDRVVVIFDLDRWQERGGLPLREALADADFRYLCQTSDTITVYAGADLIGPSRDLVTISAERLEDGDAARLLAWFHTDEPVGLPKRIPAWRPDGTRLMLAARPQPAIRPFSSHWILTPEGDAILKQGDALILNFDINTVHVGNNSVALADVIEEETLSILGFDGAKTVHVFYQVDLPPVIEVPEPDINEIVQQVIETMPALPFVTITAGRTRLQVDPNLEPVPVVLFEVWFHLDLPPERDVMRIGEKPSFVVFAELEDQSTPRELTSLQFFRAMQHNVLLYFVPEDVYKEEVNGSPYLRFVFPTEKNQVVDSETGSTVSLQDYILKMPVKFEGHNGRGTIVSYVRVPGQGAE